MSPLGVLVEVHSEQRAGMDDGGCSPLIMSYIYNAPRHYGSVTYSLGHNMYRARFSLNLSLLLSYLLEYA